MDLFKDILNDNKNELYPLQYFLILINFLHILFKNEMKLIHLKITIVLMMIKIHLIKKVLF